MVEDRGEEIQLRIYWVPASKEIVTYSVGFCDALGGGQQSGEIAQWLRACSALLDDWGPGT